jgi:hypothetical protein
MSVMNYELEITNYESLDSQPARAMTFNYVTPSQSTHYTQKRMRS